MSGGRSGAVRNTLNEAKCDLWPGVASGVDMVATTRPYYRSTYVFVTRADKPLGGLTLDDPRLKTLSISVQMVGDDAMNTPPAHAMASRGLIANVRGHMATISSPIRRPRSSMRWRGTRWMWRSSGAHSPAISRNIRRYR